MFNFNQAKNLYLADLRTNDMSDKTLDTYAHILGYYAAFCGAESLDMFSPASVAAYKARMASKGNKLVTLSMHLNILRLFFDFCIRCRLMDHQATNPVLPELMPPRKKIRAERKPYMHLMDETDISGLFSTDIPKGVKRHLYLRNRAIVLMLVGCGLRNTELRMLRPCDLRFASDETASVTVWAGKGDKFRTVPFPLPVQQAVKAYMAQGNRPSGLTDHDLLFGVGESSQEWHSFSRECLSDMVKRYVKSATGYEGARSHACRHAFASLMLTSGVPMAEIQSMLGHSSIITTEHYATLLRPTAPTGSGNKVFNDKFAQLAIDP